MGQEIERKFLVAGESWRENVRSSVRIRQGYVARADAAVVRVRQIEGAAAFLTIKSTQPGLVRAEFEYEIPPADAEALLREACAAPLIVKLRHHLDWKGKAWVVDEFEAALAGLVLAEVELDSANEAVDIPTWAAREVTDDPAYRNDALARALRKTLD